MVITHLQKSQEPRVNSVEIESLYGTVVIDEPVLIELLNCAPVARLKKINQYGINFYTTKKYLFTRYDHSVGVLILLRLFNCSLLEQIAGLLHDVSHTVFSHVTDYVYKVSDKKHSYQDSIHEWYLEHTDIPEILSKYGIAVQDILHKKGCFKALECDLPNICADRIEYILRGIFLEQRATINDIQNIVSHLRFDAQQGWFFVDAQAALMLGNYSLNLCESHFGAAWNMQQNIIAARLLQRALDIHLITSEQIHFGVDADIWQILSNSTDEQVCKYITMLVHGESIIHHTPETTATHVRPKFRGVDPLVQTPEGFAQLTKLDTEYAAAYARVREIMQQGWYLSL